MFGLLVFKLSAACRFCTLIFHWQITIFNGQLIHWEGYPEKVTIIMIVDITRSEKRYDPYVKICRKKVQRC